MQQSVVDNHLTKAIELLYSGDLVGANSIAHQMNIDFPDNPKIMNVLGTILSQQGDHSNAIQLLSRAIALSPGSPGLYNNLGNIYKSLGDTDGAIESYKTALNINPGSSLTLNNLGTIYKDINDHDNAKRYFQRSLQYDPVKPQTLYNLATTHFSCGELNDAVSLYRKTIDIEPNMVAAVINLGSALQMLGNIPEAITAFRRAKKLDPTNAQACHLLSSLTGETYEGSPENYAKILFDGYASSFDHSLAKVLECKIPQLLKEMLDESIKSGCKFDTTLDLGCGTGLSGAEFRSVTGELIGIDISEKMIAQARLKHLYDDLHVSNITDYLRSVTERKFDLFVSADVFVYVGDLSEIFQLIASLCNPGAYFLFSVETLIDDDNSDYLLRETGRYAHSMEYIKSLVVQHNFRVIDSKQVNLRKNFDAWIKGELFLLQNIYNSMQV